MDINADIIINNVGGWGLVLPGVTAANVLAHAQTKFVWQIFVCVFTPRFNSSMIVQLFVDFVRVYGCSRQPWPHTTCVLVRCTYNVLFPFGGDIIVRGHYGSIISECCLFLGTRERVIDYIIDIDLTNYALFLEKEMATYWSWWKSNINSRFETYVLIRHQL